MRMKRRSKFFIVLFIIFVIFVIFVFIAIAAALAARLPAPAAPAPFAEEASATATEPPFLTVSYSFGRGYIGDGWQVYFNEPDASGDGSDYADGIDEPFASAIEAAERSLDIAIFELNNRRVYDAILAAHRRGLAVRIVTDDKHGLEDDTNSELRELAAAGLPIVTDQRSGLMHNKFSIIDARAVWTGSWNYTRNGTYRNNNNILVLQSAPAVAAYQAEFNEMFERGEFGARSSHDGIVNMTDGTRALSVIFAPEADEIAALTAAIQAARSSIHFMSFVFSLDALADAMIEKLEDPDFVLRGVLEHRNSTASWSQLPSLLCAGAQARQDGNRYIMHHKVIIIDADTVITGSFNFSKNAAQNNDENIVIMRDPVIASLYLEEWRRVWDSAQEAPPGEIICA